MILNWLVLLRYFIDLLADMDHECDYIWLVHNKVIDKKNTREVILIAQIIFEGEMRQDFQEKLQIVIYADGGGAWTLGDAELEAFIMFSGFYFIVPVLLLFFFFPSVFSVFQFSL